MELVAYLILVKRFSELGRKFYIAGWIIHPTAMNSKRIAIIATLVSLAIATNYAMMPFYNIKLMDIIVFLGGFCFGPLAGALIGVTSWAVYGTLNPLGFSIPVLLATMFSIAVGIGFGLWSARQGARLNPLETLRYE